MCAQAGQEQEQGQRQGQGLAMMSEASRLARQDTWAEFSKRAIIRGVDLLVAGLMFGVVLQVGPG